MDGLPTVKVNDLVTSDAGIRGWVSALLPDRVEVLLLDEGPVQPGQLFQRSGQKLNVPAGQFLLGRAINPLGIPIDGHGPLGNTKADLPSDIDKTAPGINFREFITKQLETGITVVDTIIPIGKGQRELVVGDARSGKTDFLIDLIVNQGKTKTICVYASIGKPIAEVRGLIDLLEQNQALKHTIIVASSSTDLAPLIFLTPQTAFAIAEKFQSRGQDVLIILDDMGNHAKIHREISLLAGRAPGRESYPGDIFYQHSHLLERAGNFNTQAGSGSITALPVIELNLNDFTGFIPTNLMSMTDGHLLFKSALYNQGQRPPIDITLSVSRVGQQTQKRIQNLLATRVKQVLAQAAQLETISRFSFELPFETRQILSQRANLEEIIKQPPLTFIPAAVQTILLALPFTGIFQGKDPEYIKINQKVIIDMLISDQEILKISESLMRLENLERFFKELQPIVNKLQMKLAPPGTTQEPVKEEKSG